MCSSDLVNLEWHSPSGRAPRRGSPEAEVVDMLLNTASMARFEPAKFDGLPVAVNVVWLVANTTVRAPKATLDAPIVPADADAVVQPPAPRKRRVDVALPVAIRRSAVA